MEPKNLQNRGPNPPKSSPTEPRGVQDNPKTEKQHIPNKKEGGAPQPPPHFGGNCGQHGSKLASKIDQKLIKIDAKIDQKIDASWDRFLDGFWWISGTKMKPSWHQNGIKNGVVRKSEKTHLELAR